MANLDVFQQLRIAIADGIYREEFPVETLLPDTWTDSKTGTEYNMPHRLVSYQTVKLADSRKVLGAILRRENILPDRMQFDENSVFFGESSLKEYLNTDYLAECSLELRKAMAEVIIGESSPNDPRKVCCKVFVPCTDDIQLDIARSLQDEASQFWECFRHTAENWTRIDEKRIFRNFRGIERYVWLRTRYTPSTVCGVLPTGKAFQSTPSRLFWVVPVCVIVGADVKL